MVFPVNIITPGTEIIQAMSSASERCTLQCKVVSHWLGPYGMIHMADLVQYNNWISPALK